MIRLALVAVALALACHEADAAKLDLNAVNRAQFVAGEAKGNDPAVLKAQILLDRARFSPGLIDGRNSENFTKAVTAFQSANGLPSDGNLTQETWDRLMASSANPALVTYLLTRKDVRGPFTKHIPARMSGSRPSRHRAPTSAVGATESLPEANDRQLESLTERAGLTQEGRWLARVRTPAMICAQTFQ